MIGGMVERRRVRRKTRSQRAWALVRARKLDHWAAQYKNLGSMGALRIAEELRAHAEELGASFSNLAARRKDWEHHARLRALLDRAAHALVHHSRSNTSR